MNRHPAPAATPDRWHHDHGFGQDKAAAGERRTLLVVVLTAVTMVVEVGAGLWTGSMALLADGVHMASHMVALAISLFAYVYARRHAHDPRFSFGTGKVNALAGFTGALLLAVVALGMGWESLGRLLAPGDIAFDEAIAVAVLGLLVNAASVVILGGHGHHDHDHDHDYHHNEGHHGEGQHGHGAHDHDHDHPDHDHHGHDHHGHGHHGHGHHGHGHEDHNLRSAYLHVLTDALTSVLAIAALLGGKYAGAGWLDPVMGIVGAVLVANWSRGLLRTTSGVLLDHQAAPPVLAEIRAAVERGGDRVSDLHVWSVAPGVHAGILCVVSPAPQPPDHYRALVPADLGIRHLTVEVNQGG
ncbi:cation diffusion facilitator family transporter [Oleisolibacter albus]|uniref:cation diffusion facilitator family transporter n=1 Tax=Oleisolibacter albus TaxID=2171757 RepID=UPI000DF3AF5A|nr:cation diffusion facilitator family transporter [Oleisolibacter albus]